MIFISDNGIIEEGVSQTSNEVMQLLREVNRTEGVTMIIVTHDPNVAAQTDRLIKIQDGIIGDN